MVANNTGVTLKPSDLGITNKNYIGKSQFADPMFKGSVDEFKIYNRALNAPEVLNAMNTNSQLNLSTKDGKFLKGENEIIDSIQWVKGLSPDMNKNNSVVFVDVINIIEPTPKTLDEAKGIITADYQNYLEKEWIKSLRAKYPVTVNEDVLNSFSK